MKEPDCLLGAHFSIAKGLDRALYTAAEYGCSAVQIFTKNASTWKERVLSDEDIRRFEAARKRTGITRIASHTSYLINPASDEKKKSAMSREALKQELVRCAALDIPFVVLHPGSHRGSGVAAGIARIVSVIRAVFDALPGNPVRLLLETTAGQGAGIGHRFEQIADIMAGVENGDRLGVCLDTCHVFAAGYDLRTEAAYRETFQAFDAIIGLERLYWIHVNDSARELGARVDRHAHIGRGFIGETAFRMLMGDRRLRHIPKVLETPKGDGEEDWDEINLKRLKSFCGQGDETVSSRRGFYRRTRRSS